MKKPLATAALIVLGACGALVGVAAQTKDDRPAKTDQASIAAGKRLVADTCQNDHCHGGGARNFEDFTGLTAPRVRRAINEGLPGDGMQSFKEVFSPDEIEQIVAYVLSVSQNPGTGTASMSSARAGRCAAPSQRPLIAPVAAHSRGFAQ